MAHLWEINHPFFGADGHENPCNSFDELSKSIDALNDHMNFVYRWDWQDWSQSHYDDLYLSDEERSKQNFVAYLVMPRKEILISFTCPITYDQEPDVLAWLRSDRVLGNLRRWWEPLLDLPDPGRTW
jgi:hypothetical protein